MSKGKKAMELAFLFVVLSLHGALSEERSENSVSEDQLFDLLQATEFHYANFKRSFEELERTVKLTPAHKSAWLKHSGRSKRSASGQLFASFMSFCETLQNESGSSLASHETKPKPRWESARARVMPLRVETRQRANGLMVEFTVNHSVNAYVMVSLNGVKRGQATVHHMNIRKRDPISKISKERFFLDTSICFSKKLIKSEAMAVTFIFGESKSSYANTALVLINKCRGIRNENGTINKNKTLPAAGEEHIYFSRFKFSLTNTTILAGNGTNTTFNIVLAASRNPRFLLSTLIFSRNTVRLTKTFWTVSGHQERNGSYQLDYAKQSDSGNDKMAGLEIVSADESIRSMTRGKEPNEQAPPPRLRVHLNTASDLETGVISLSQPSTTAFYDDKFLVKSTQLVTNLYIRQNDLPHFRLPNGTVAVSNSSGYICNEKHNPPAESDEPNGCGVRCSVSGGDISDITLYQIKPQSNYYEELHKGLKLDTQVSPTGEWATAKLTSDKPGQYFDGEYICRVLTKIGVEKEIRLIMS